MGAVATIDREAIDREAIDRPHIDRPHIDRPHIDRAHIDRAHIDRARTDLAGAVAATGVGPVDVVADVVAGPAFGGLLDALRPFGRYVTAGAIAGPLVETDLRTVYLKQLQLIGSSFASHEEFAELVELLRAANRGPRTGRLRSLLAGAYPLKDLARAQADFVAKRFFGKLVIVLDG